MEDKFEKALENVLKRIASTSDSGDAMRFSQAACNIQHAEHTYNQNRDMWKKEVNE